MTTRQQDRRTDRKPDPVAELIEFKPYRDGYAVRFDYDPFLVAFVKKLPPPQRKFVADRKYWMLSAHAGRFLASVAGALGYTVTGIDTEATA
jgi:hypothetical protein